MIVSVFFLYFIQIFYSLFISLIYYYFQCIRMSSASLTSIITRHETTQRDFTKPKKIKKNTKGEVTLVNKCGNIAGNMQHVSRLHLLQCVTRNFFFWKHLWIWKWEIMFGCVLKTGTPNKPKWECVYFIHLSFLMCEPDLIDSWGRVLKKSSSF